MLSSLEKEKAFICLNKGKQQTSIRPTSSPFKCQFGYRKCYFLQIVSPVTNECFTIVTDGEEEDIKVLKLVSEVVKRLIEKHFSGRRPEKSSSLLLH